MHLIDSINDLGTDDMETIRIFSNGMYKGSRFKNSKFVNKISKSAFSYLFNNFYICDFMSFIPKANQKQWMLDVMLDNDFNLNFQTRDFKNLSAKLITKDNVEKILKYNNRILNGDFLSFFNKGIDDSLFLSVVEDVVNSIKSKEAVYSSLICFIIRLGENYKNFNKKEFQCFLLKEKINESDFFNEYAEYFNYDLFNKADLFKIVKESNEFYLSSVCCKSIIDSIIKKDESNKNIFDVIEGGLKSKGLGNTFSKILIKNIEEALEKGDVDLNSYSEDTIVYILSHLASVIDGGRLSLDDKKLIVERIKKIYSQSNIPLEDILIPFLIQMATNVVNDNDMDVIKININPVSKIGIHWLKEYTEKEQGKGVFEIVLKDCLDKMAKYPKKTNVAYRLSEKNYHINEQEFISSIIKSYSLGFIDKDEMNNLALTYIKNSIKEGAMNAKRILSEFPISLMNDSFIDKIKDINMNDIEILMALITNKSFSDFGSFDNRKDYILEMFENNMLKASLMDNKIISRQELKL